MELISLPTELLERIITLALPEGFEGVTLSCRKIYAVCTPFIQSHNALRSQFHNIDYYENMTDPSCTITTAFDLISRIAIEPVVACYIRHADFEMDSRPPRRATRELPPDVHAGGAVVRLLARSIYLKQAGLDWKEYYAAIIDDLQATIYSSCYSQHAAAFLLTLLPNVETLRLPRRWRPVGATDQLLDAVFRRAKQSHLSYDAPSLAQVTRFGPYAALVPQEWFDLDKATPFLALPHMKSFHGPSCVAMGDNDHKSIASQNPDDGFGHTLETVLLEGCCIDEVAMADFLKHTIHLRTLRYSHMTKGDRGAQDWNICKFVTAIDHAVGSHLEELSISIREFHGSIAPGTTSMRGFQRLRKLEFPLEIVVCNITAAAEAFIGDLVPATVSQLSLISGGTDDHAKTLNVMFWHFAARKASTLPALDEIQLSCPDGADDAYKEQCAKLLTETEKVDVVLHLKPFPSTYTITWSEE